MKKKDKLALPKKGLSSEYYKWIDGSCQKELRKINCPGFHCLTDLGREKWLKKFGNKFSQVDPDLKKFLDDNNLSSSKNRGTGRKSFNYDNTGTLYFQMYHLCFALPGLALRREDLEAWINKVKLKIFYRKKEWREPGDAIQGINKEYGILRAKPQIEGSTYYYIPKPFQLTTGFTADKKLTLPTDEKTAQVMKIKIWLEKTFLDVEVRKWSKGHRDPNSKEGVYQPESYNRALRDRFKFDERGLRLNPTVSELSKNLKKYYPSKEEQRELLDILKKELEKSK
jgi:hypothetical protein